MQERRTGDGREVLDVCVVGLSRAHRGRLSGWTSEGKEGKDRRHERLGLISARWVCRHGTACFFHQPTLPGSPPRRRQYRPNVLEEMAGMPRIRDSNAAPPSIQASTSCCRVTWCRVTAISTHLF